MDGAAWIGRSVGQFRPTSVLDDGPVARLAATSDEGLESELWVGHVGPSLRRRLRWRRVARVRARADGRGWPRILDWGSADEEHEYIAVSPHRGLQLQLDVLRELSPAARLWVLHETALCVAAAHRYGLYLGGILEDGLLLDGNANGLSVQVRGLGLGSLDGLGSVRADLQRLW
jgi:hypothetical protein